jgi:HEAT repeat protein
MSGSHDLATVDDFIGRYRALPNKKRRFQASDLPIAEMQTAAIRHRDPWVRRTCLSFLDHYANDESTTTFLAALDDPVTPVREMALHGLACERCRTTELCVEDVVPVLSRVVDADASPDIRQKAIPILMRLAPRDSRARTALEGAARVDSDPLIRAVAVAALEGRTQDALRSRHDLLRRAKTRRSKAASLGGLDT